MYIYVESEPGLWTVGRYNQDRRFEPESDHPRKEDAANRVAWLNGGKQRFEKSFVFHIDHPGEPAAGIRSFTDLVTIMVESGDPGGDEGQFAEYIRQILTYWYDFDTVKQR